MTGSSRKKPGTSAQMSRGKRSAFACAAVILSLGVLVVIEVLLRAFGWGGHLPIVRELGVTENGTLMTTDPAGSAQYFFANTAYSGGTYPYAFLMPKPEDTVRVFLFGASAIKGYPYPRNLTPSAFLEAMLSDLWPERRVEVINFGATAVASFPVLDMVRQTLRYEPDLVVIYSGHNEFYGTYGTASSNRAGSRPWLFPIQHRARSLGMVQALASLAPRPEGTSEEALKEVMVGQTSVGPESWRRATAANNLHFNVGRMIRACRKNGVPILVCSLPSNERDLAPVGEDEPAEMSTNEVAEVNRILADAAADWRARPDEVRTAMEALLLWYPTLSRAHFLLGKSLHGIGDYEAANEHFVRARDLDTMPWRATTQLQQALRDAAAEEGATICDAEALFREQSPGGSIGWELMNDHVHPTVRGQALVAEAIVRSLPDLAEAVRVATADLGRLRPWEAYADELGDNEYDRYGVDRWMIKMFQVDFMNKSNPHAYERFAEMAIRFEMDQPEEIREVLRRWDGSTPLTALVGRELARSGKHEEALPVLQIVPKVVPPYSPWRISYVYEELKCAQKVAGQLSDGDRARAREEIARGDFLLGCGVERQWVVQQVIGRLYMLLGEYGKAIPYMIEARSKLLGAERVAEDHALAEAYLQTGQAPKAREIANRGIEFGGSYAPAYQRLLGIIESRTGAGKDVPASGGEASVSETPEFGP